MNVGHSVHTTIEEEATDHLDVAATTMSDLAEGVTDLADTATKELMIGTLDATSKAQRSSVVVYMIADYEDEDNLQL